MSRTAAFRLDRSSAVPLYRQIEDQIRTAIHDGRLRPGARLPGIRSLATDLGVARVTIATTYEQLAAEGYLVSRVGSGTVVADDPPGQPTPIGRAVGARPGAPRAPRLDLRPDASPADGVPGGFPTTAWEARIREAWRQVSSAPAPGQAGAADLRVALSAYLDGARGTRTDPGRIVVGGGPRVLVAALVAALDGEGGPDRIPVLGMLEPADPELRSVARRSGAAVLDVPTDRAMLHAAAGVVLVEDDRPSLLRLAGPVAPALQGSLAIGRIVLLGGLDPLVVPGIALAWLVVPGSLVASVATYLAALDGMPSLVEQRTIAGWIAEGGLDRRVRRLRHALLERRVALEAALRAELGRVVELEPPGSGPVVTARLPVNPGVRTGLVAAARAAGVTIGPPDDDGRLTLGCAALPAESMSDAIRRLARAIDALDPSLRRRPPEPPRPLRGPIVPRVLGRSGPGDDDSPVSASSYVVPAPSRLGSLGRALVGRRGPAVES